MKDETQRLQQESEELMSAERMEPQQAAAVADICKRAEDTCGKIMVRIKINSFVINV